MATNNGSTHSAKNLDESLEMATPTSENIMQAVAAYATGKDAQIKALEAKLAELAASESEILDLKRQKAKWFLEKKSLIDEIEKLKKELKQKVMQDLHHQAAGEPNAGLSTDAAGDGAPGTLCSKVEGIVEHLASTRIGGVQPESARSSVPAEPLVETDCQMTNPPNTHMQPPPPAPLPAATKSVIPHPETTAAGVENGPVTEGGEAVQAETKAAAATSQRDAFKKLEKGNYSSAEVSSSGKKVDSVTLDMMTWLSENIPLSDWKPLMRKLGLTDNDIDNTSFGHQNVVEKKYQCLLHWRKTRPVTETTVRALLAAIRAKSLNQLARDFNKEFPEESSLAKTKPESSPEVKRTFSSDLERFLYMFVTDFGALKRDLHNGPPMAAEQCHKIGYKSQEGNGRLDTVLEWWSSEYFKSNNADRSFDKSQALREVLSICGQEARHIFKKHVNQGGVIGPDVKSDTKIGDLPYSTIQLIEEMLSYKDGVCNWKDLADWLRKRHSNVFAAVTANKIRQWESDPDPHKGAKCVLQVWETTTQARVGTFYCWLVNNGRLDIAKVLE